MGTRERIEREKELRRERIIRAAEKLFLKKGLEGTTMEEIARKCELSKGALYLYFPGKERLYHAIVHRALAAMLELMKRSQEGLTSPVERIRMIGESYYRFYEDHPDLFRILSRVHEHDHPGECEDEEVLRIRETHNEVWALITGIIVGGMRDGTFREDTDPVEIAISLYAASSMILQILDQQRRSAGAGNSGQDPPFGSIDFRKILDNTGRRIVFSIMKNPPDNPER